MSRIAQASPVPAQTTLESAGATARAPMAATGSLSKMGFQRLPPSVDFPTPPGAAPAYQVLGSPGTPAMAATRFPLTGPRKRNPKSSPDPPRLRLWATRVPQARTTQNRHTKYRSTVESFFNIRHRSGGDLRKRRLYTKCNAIEPGEGDCIEGRKQHCVRRIYFAASELVSPNAARACWSWGSSGSAEGQD